LFDEFAGEVTLHKSIPPGINETDCDPEEEIHLIKKLLYDNLSPRPLKEFISENSYAAFESFSPSPIPVKDSDSLMEEIPPEEFVSENSDAEIESFCPSPIPVEDSDSLMEEIDLSFTPDYPMPPGIEEDDYDSERDILILDELLSNDSLSLSEI
nr:hypothetical protein [Tanacetum cinerariifolium]